MLGPLSLGIRQISAGVAFIVKTLSMSRPWVLERDTSSDYRVLNGTFLHMHCQEHVHRPADVNLLGPLSSLHLHPLGLGRTTLERSNSPFSTAEQSHALPHQWSAAQLLPMSLSLSNYKSPKMHPTASVIPGKDIVPV